MGDEVLIGGIERREIRIVDYDPRWPMLFTTHSLKIESALGKVALSIEHVGSTSVPNLAAKPIIDIIVVVQDSGREESYLRALENAGYVLRVRERDWNQHRMLRTPSLDVHVHIFSVGCAEVRRQLAFRDWLRLNPDDRMQYEMVKRKLAMQEWPDMNAYARAKTEVVERITAKALANQG